MPNKIKVLYFAAVKDITGKESEEIEIQEDATLNTLSVCLITKYGHRLQEILSTSMYAVDMEYVEKDKESATALKKDSEVAIIPPVSGG
ncbi:hypothetical protein G6F56_013852 [Rhizopus delemar]|nr:hypothetical protein G6F56_013852 [Rhizopus delemar]